MVELENRLLTEGLTADRGTSSRLHSLKVAGSKRDGSVMDAARFLATSTKLKDK